MLGPGKIDLLEAIARKGSISAVGPRDGHVVPARLAAGGRAEPGVCLPARHCHARRRARWGAQVTEFGLQVAAAYRRIVERTHAAILEEMARFEVELMLRGGLRLSPALVTAISLSSASAAAPVSMARRARSTPSARLAALPATIRAAAAFRQHDVAKRRALAREDVANGGCIGLRVATLEIAEPRRRQPCIGRRHFEHGDRAVLELGDVGGTRRRQLVEPVVPCTTQTRSAPSLFRTCAIGSTHCPRTRRPLAA